MTVKNIFNSAKEFAEQPLFVLRPQLHRHLQDGDICRGLPAHEQVGGGEIVIFCSSLLEFESVPRHNILFLAQEAWVK